jgi:hypothetical protein
VLVRLTNACGSVDSTFTVYKRRLYLNLKNLQIIHPNVLNINSPIDKNRKLTIYEWGVNEGSSLAYYGATDAKLDILNRWGGIHKAWEYTNQTFINGQLQWNGYIDGKAYPQESLHWRLSLKNCRNRNWEDNFDSYKDYVCHEYKWKWNGSGWSKVCVRGTYAFEKLQWHPFQVLH